MGCVLAGGGDAVMAAAAGAGDITVIETRTSPADCIVAGIAFCAGCNMLG